MMNNAFQIPVMPQMNQPPLNGLAISPNMPVQSTSSSYAAYWMLEQAGMMQPNLNYAPSQMSEMSMQSTMTGTMCSEVTGKCMEKDPMVRLGDIIESLADSDMDVNLLGNDLFQKLFETYRHVIGKDPTAPQRLQEVFGYTAEKLHLVTEEMKRLPQGNERLEVLKKAVWLYLRTIRLVYRYSTALQMAENPNVAKYKYIHALLFSAVRVPGAIELVICPLYHAKKHLNPPPEALAEIRSPEILYLLLDVKDLGSDAERHLHYLFMDSVEGNRQCLNELEKQKPITEFVLRRVINWQNVLETARNPAGPICFIKAWLKSLNFLFDARGVDLDPTIFNKNGFVKLAAFLSLFNKKFVKQEDFVSINTCALNVLVACSSDSKTLKDQELQSVLQCCFGILICLEDLSRKGTPNPQTSLLSLPILQLITNLLVMNTTRVDYVLFHAREVQSIRQVFPVAFYVHGKSSQVLNSQSEKIFTQLLEVSILIICELNKSPLSSGMGSSLIFQPQKARDASAVSLNDILECVVFRPEGTIYQRLDYRNVERVARCWKRAIEVRGACGNPQRLPEEEAVFFQQLVHLGLRFLGQAVLNKNPSKSLCGAMDSCIELLRVFTALCPSNIKLELAGTVTSIDSKIIFQSSEYGARCLLRSMVICIKSLNPEDRLYVTSNLTASEKMSSKDLNEMLGQFPNCQLEIQDLRDIMNPYVNYLKQEQEEKTYVNL
ncbi:unnamed protein product [Bursaphelenchus xylophilus]|uniref:(pine wood nematode) hypothetical protein n=1 Tax=Bursaphelenchus xylophilus TaxID=6326 RepID=A0A7I8WYT3_BURXY|nr:unnamed protein product [Bursaphelenchus xylophilus]CAG9101934.1 unnamed protein product [Bursaphelenchus xylophilus]